MSLRREVGAIALSPIPPEQRGLPAQADWAERASTIRLTTAAPEDAVRRFADGKAQVVLGGTFAEWPAVLASSLPGQAIRVDPALGLFGLAPTHHDGFLAEPENREAISLLIDREAFADALRGPGWSPTARIVDPGFTDAAELVRERWTGLTMEQRRAVAQSRITRWRSRKGEVTLRIALPTGPGADLLFNRLTADLGAAGLKVQRSELGKPADLELIDAVAPYHSPRWVFLRLSCQSRPASCSPAADVAFAQAIALTDEGARAPALAEAEARLTADNTFIPLGPPLRWTLASPDTDGIFPNAWALHPLLPLAVRADK